LTKKKLLSEYLLLARVAPGGLNSSQTDGSGQPGVLSALADGVANFGGHDGDVTQSLQSRNDFDLILRSGRLNLALVAQQFAKILGQLLNIGARLAFLRVTDAEATSHTGDAQKSNGGVRFALNQRL